MDLQIRHPVVGFDKNCPQIIELLYPLSNPSEALEVLQQDHPVVVWKGLVDRIEAARVKSLLETKVGFCVPSKSTTRKM